MGMNKTSHSTKPLRNFNDDTDAKYNNTLFFSLKFPSSILLVAAKHFEVHGLAQSTTVRQNTIIWHEKSIL